MAEGSSLSESQLTEQNLTHIRALNELAGRRGQSLAQLALAWALRDPRVTSVLIGASSVRQLEQNVAALDNLDFTDDELAEIDRYAVEGGINLWQESSSGLSVGPIPRLARCSRSSVPGCRGPPPTRCEGGAAPAHRWRRATTW